MGSDEDSTERAVNRKVLVINHGLDAQQAKADGDPILSEEHMRAGRLIEADPSPLIAAIRAYTVDAPNDEPNGDAERECAALGEALLADGNIEAARDHYASMMDAEIGRLVALREAAEAYFGGDFSKAEDDNG